MDRAPGSSRIAVAIPSGDVVHTDFAICLAILAASTPNPPLLFINVKYSILSAARNYLVDAARKLRADYIFFLDTDMTFPPDTLRVLLAHEKDIVGAVYPKRSPPFSVVGARLSSGGADEGGRLVEMALMPTGCLLVRMAVFDRFRQPIFRYSFDEASGETVGEDYHFSALARREGFKLWCDLDLSRKIGHIGQITRTADV